MIPYLKAQIEKLVTLEAQRAVVREYLQMRILQSFSRSRNGHNKGAATAEIAWT
jgi:hypothetical protein